MRANVNGDTWTFEGPSLRFTGSFRDEGKIFGGVWEQRVGEGADWLAWMDIVLSKVK